VATAALDRPDKFRIGRVLGDSFAVIGRNPFLCLGLVLIFQGLPRVVFAILLWVTSGEPGVAELSIHRVIGIVQLISGLCIDGVLQAALACVAIDDLRDGRPSLRACIRMTKDKFLSVIGIFLIVNVPLRIIVFAVGKFISLPINIPFPFNFWAFLVCLVLAPIPGMALLVRWFVAVPALMRERSGVLKSLTRSRDLTKGSRRPLLGLWLIFIVAEIGIGLATNRMLPRIVIDAVISTAYSVGMAIVIAASYAELRRVKEGTSADELAEMFS
jgi:hypothetical protein